MTVLPLWRRSRRETAASLTPVTVRPREAFVFSGGGSLGAAQVGALQALFEAGITPDVVVGCSVGALNAAYVAVDPTAARVSDLAELWRRLTRSQIFPDGRFRVAQRLAAREDHLYSPNRSEEHTSELQSRPHLVCRLLLEKKNKKQPHHKNRTPLP